MSQLLRLNGALRHDPAVDAWLSTAGLDPEIGAHLPRPDAPLRVLARTWFAEIRSVGNDVLELIHDSRPVACVRDAPFAYVNIFRAHVNLGFFQGAALPDPARLLHGTGKRMRHVKLVPASPPDEAALRALIAASYHDVRARLAGAEG